MLQKRVMKKTRFITPTILIAVLAYLGCNLQNQMLYYPSSHVPSPESLAQDRIKFWPSALDGYRGFIGIFPAANIKGTMVVFHGNAGTAADRTYYVHALSPLGYRVILAEYPGYGARKGELDETTLVNDAKETVRLAADQYGSPVFLLGESLGCAIAAAVAREAPVKIGGVILITPWDTLHSVAKGHYPWLPVGLFLKDKYDTVNNMKTFRGRTAIIGTEHDQIVPIRHAQSLYESISGKKKMWTIKGAGHNDWPDVVDRSWWKEITGFIGADW
jgi:pimeloyl-ACP methyl ester carboxylesterase